MFRVGRGNWLKGWAIDKEVIYWREVAFMALDSDRMFHDSSVHFR